VDPTYFEVLRIPILRGRAFRAEDGADAGPVAVVNETLARRLAPGGDAVGRSFVFRDRETRVVGIARDARYATLAEETPPFVYAPLAQLWQPRQTVLVRTAPGAAVPGPELRSAVGSIDSTVPPPVVVPLEETIRVALLPQRIASGVTTALGGVAGFLAIVGLYGIVVGLLLSAAGTRVLRSLLFGLSPLDGLALAGATLLLLLAAFLGSYLPARRAAALDPVTVLRSE